MIVVSNLQFRPSELSVLPGTTIEFIIEEHEPSELYPPGERKFILEGATFASGCLKEGDSFCTEVWESQVITCPFYSHMQCTVTVQGQQENPQNSNLLLRNQVYSKSGANIIGTLESEPIRVPSCIHSNSNSHKDEELEAKQVVETQEDLQYQGNPTISPSVKEECKRNHVSLFNFEEFACKDSDELIISEQKDEMRAISSSETKRGVTFTMIGIGPKRNLDIKDTNQKKKKKQNKKKTRPALYLNYFLSFVRRSLAYFDMNRWNCSERDSKKKKELVNRKRKEFKKVISKCEEELKDFEPKITEIAKLKLKEFVTDRERNILEKQAYDPVFQCYIIRKIFACNLSGVKEKLRKIKGSDTSHYSCNLDAIVIEEQLHSRWNFK